MRTFLVLFQKVCLMGLNYNYEDEDLDFLLYDFAMNYSIDSLRTGYNKWMENENSKVDDDLLRELGYSEEDILMNK